MSVVRSETGTGPKRRIALGEFAALINRVKRAFGGAAGQDELLRSQQQAEAQLLEQKLQLDTALNNMAQGLCMFDAAARLLLCYKRSADLFQSGARLEDTLRIGVARGDYPEAAGREEEWIAERLAKLYAPSGRHEQTLADGRCILIEERRTGDGGIIGLRVDITEMKQREASFRLLFDSNPVPMFVYGRDSPFRFSPSIPPPCSITAIPARSSCR